MLFYFLLIAFTVADQCADGTYWDQSAENCVDCTNNVDDENVGCETCWSKEKCTSCKHVGTDEMQWYYLNSNYKCVKRDPNPHCKTWDGLYCIECQDGHYISNMNCNETCRIEGCAKCNTAKCFKCDSGLTLYETTDGNSLTQECIDCSKSENDKKCGRCPLGEYFNTTSFKCEQCRDGCDRCTTWNNCYLCAGDSALEIPSDPTSACVTIENCTSGHYYGNHCELCDEGSYVFEGKCKPCGENCARCINENQCVECMQGSTLSDGKCEKDEYCIRSSDLMGCIECKEGYYLGTDGKCKKCPESCASCLNENYCFRCAKDYYFTDVANGKCKKMDEEQCSVTDQFGCLQCKYDVPVSNVTESKIADQLKNFEDYLPEGSENGESSKERFYGFYLPYTYTNETGVVYEKECRLCNPRCRICEYNANWCTGCNEGFEMEEKPEYTEIFKEHFGLPTQIHTCVPKSDECEETEMGYCIKCVGTHFLSGIDCVKCDESCETCTEEGFCQTCKNHNGTNQDYDEMFWRPPYLTQKEGKEKGKCFRVNESRLNDQLLHCGANGIQTSGCTDCEVGYYKDDDEGDCFECGIITNSDSTEKFRCKTCSKKKKSQMNITAKSDEIYCESCFTPDNYLKDGVCISCKTIEHCNKCNNEGCDECEEGYSVNSERSECTRVNLELILPLVAVGLIFIIIIIVVIVILIWRHRKKTMKEREKEIKPFKVSNEVEMALLSADNEKFPLKTSTWTLDFGYAGSKVVIDQDYEQTIQIMNPTRKSYFFEILSGASHRYELNAEPMRFTLKPDYAIEVKFTIKMLCTAIVKDEIGIVAMDMDEEVKETAKLTIMVESDLSTKLDHTELKLQMPAIGEGAFGMVFVGTYRGQKVAVKKMKARNLTEEQEKEFKHEVNMLTQYRHATIVNLVGAVYTEGEISIVTEFADYGSLSKVWGKEKISYDLKIKFMEDAVVALSYLHENSILHRDVKGENVLVYSLNPHSPVCGKLTDFGTCRNISERSLASKELSQGIGTPTYMAPECLGNNSYSYQADVYSFAIVLYETFTEVQAYIEDERFNQPWMIPQFVIEGKRLERPDGMPDNYWALIEQCWQHEPEDRPLFPQIYATLASWGLDICNTEMAAKAAPLDLPTAGGDAGEIEEGTSSSSSSSSSSEE